MSTTVTVALITSLSTLSAGLLASLIGLKVQKGQVMAQAALAVSERDEKRLLRCIDSRKQAYLQFLNQANDAELLIQQCWEDYVPDKEDSEASENMEKLWNSITDLERATNVVAIEGPEEVAALASSYRTVLRD